MCKRLLTFYGIVHRHHPHNLLSVVSSKDEAFEYIETMVRLSHIEDYKAWAYFNHISDLSDKDNWRRYAQTRLTREDFSEFLISKFKLDPKGISISLRSLNCCLPIGCSFDIKQEYESLAKAITFNKALKDVAQTICDSENINPNLKPENAQILKEELNKQNVEQQPGKEI